MSTDSELSQMNDDMQLSMANHFDNLPQADKLQRKQKQNLTM